MLISKYKDKDDAPFKNWYSNFSDLPYEQAIYNCQKENLRWDITIRKRYCALMASLFALTVIGIIVNAIFQRSNILSLIATLSSAAPLFSYYFNTIKKLCKDISMQKHLSDVIKKIDEKQNKKSIWDEIQKLQVEIFRYRKKLYLIPDWFYKLSRRKMQSIEDTFAETVSEDYRSAKF